MSVHSRFAETLDKIASITSIVRTRSEDGVRTEVNGGANGALNSRLESQVKRLEAVAAKLEATI